MSASTVSITANPAAAARRTPVLAGEKKSNFDYPTNESLTNGGVGEAGGTSKDPIQAIVDRDLGPVTRRSVSAATETNQTAAQRRTRKVASPKPEKARWKRVVRVFAKQLAALLIIVGLIQATRKMILQISPPSPSSPTSSSFETETVLSRFESRIKEVDNLVKSTAETIQVQVESLDKKIEREARSFKEEFETESSGFYSELKKIESRFDSLEKSIEEVNSKPLVSRDELDRIYEELKKGKVDDSSFSEISIYEMRAYARDIMEKEIEKHAADGLGLVDFALASGGAFVMQHSDPFIVGKGSNWFATTSRRVHNNAVKMLSPSFGEPGQCFALKGNNGYVQIRLRGPIVPEAFTLEHVAKNVAYDRSSAPKDCRVSGWLQGRGHDRSDETEKIQLLTEFTYDLDRSNAQTFNILDSTRTGLVDTIRLDFTSNHGSNSHTCIYRFRVHGRVPDPTSVVETRS